MASMKSLMLGAAILAGAVGLGATNANAAQFGIYIGSGPAAYAPPCPGPGYSWVAGYWDDGYWVPGRWAYMGDYDRDDFYRHRDWDGDRYYGGYYGGGRYYRGDDHHWGRGRGEWHGEYHRR